MAKLNTLPFHPDAEARPNAIILLKDNPQGPLLDYRLTVADFKKDLVFKTNVSTNPVVGQIAEMISDGSGNPALPAVSAKFLTDLNSTVGIGNGTTAGLLSLSSSLTSTLGVSSGVAATPLAIKTLQDAKPDKSGTETITGQWTFTDRFIAASITSLASGVNSAVIASAASTASGPSSSVLSSSSSTATATWSTVTSAFNGNATANYAMVMGSQNATASGVKSLVAASSDSTALGENAVVIGSKSASIAAGARSAVIASNVSSTSTSGIEAAVIASDSSQANGANSVVLGSEGGAASGSRSAVISSKTATATNFYSVVLGSLNSNSTGIRAAVMSSEGSTANGHDSAIIASNASSTSTAGFYSAVLASDNSQANGANSVVTASYDVQTLGVRSVVIASDSSQANGANSVVLGLTNGIATGDNAAVIASDNVNAKGGRSTVIACNSSVVEAFSYGVTLGGVYLSANAEGAGVFTSRATKNSTDYSLAFGYHATNTTAATANQSIRLESNGGVGRFAGGTTTSGFDYAEFFENLNTGTIEAGTVVTLEGDKVRKAEEGEYILGVVSKTYGVLGNSADFAWVSRFLKDDFGGYITEDKEIITVGGEELLVETLTSSTREEDTISLTLEDEEGNIASEEFKISIRKDKVENPEYKEQAYTSRSDRPEEYTIVGMLGQLYVRVYEDITAPFVSSDGLNSETDTALRVMKTTSAFDPEKGYGVCFCVKTN